MRYNRHPLLSRCIPYKGLSVAQCKAVYTVKSGDALSLIADQYGVSESDLLAANPSISNPDAIQVRCSMTSASTGTQFEASQLRSSR